jgi:hypothetical protein
MHVIRRKRRKELLGRGDSSAVGLARVKRLERLTSFRKDICPVQKKDGV